MPLTADDARDLLLVRAYESPPTAPWTEADARWASEQAQRRVGGDGPAEDWLRERAAVALARLADREPAVATWRRHALGPRGLVAACAALAFIIGIAADAIGPAGRINLLAPPLLALLAWNLAVYLGLALRPLGRAPQPASAGPLRATLARLARLPGAGARRDAGARARFAADWGRAAGPLAVARVSQALHAGAAALALGTLASMYLRGLVLEFRAGWDSTFLDAGVVATLLHAVLGPASVLTGIALPDAAGLEPLRFAAGGGENAAPWIHLHAVTIAAVVVLPRLVLAAWNGWQARRLAAHFPLPLADPYFARLLRAHRDAPALVQVLPYSYRLPPGAEPGLQALLDRAFGPKLALRIGESVPQGAEGEPGRLLPSGPAVEAQAEAAEPEIVVALLSMAATPERETHGAFVEGLGRVLPEGARLVVVVDESGFRERLRGADAASRLAQRRQAWQSMLEQSAFARPPAWLFTDLSSPDLDAAEAALGAATPA